MSADHLVLETRRLLLRPLTPADIDVTLQLFTDERVMQFIGGVVDEAEIRGDFPRYPRRAGGGSIGVWVVMDRASGEKYGTACLLPLPIDKYDTDWDLVDESIPVDYEVELGYLLRPAAWGRGIATEVAGEMIRFAFESTGLPGVTAVIEHGHEKSRQVLLKTGFTETGPRRAYNSDCIGFRINREQWPPPGGR